jgi:hypothetical protein
MPFLLCVEAHPPSWSGVWYTWILFSTSSPRSQMRLVRGACASLLQATENEDLHSDLWLLTNFSSWFDS